MTQPTCCDPCPQDCPSVFDRVHVSYLIRGGTRVVWDLLPEFADPLPWEFTLQVGKSANPMAGDWEDVGISVENTFYAIDGEQRVWGKTNFTHYRVKLETTDGTYYSDPVGGLGILEKRDWRIAREIVRKERLRNKLATNNGYLLKRRISGARCTQCTDFQTDEVRNPDCEECWGTGFQCGYFYPMGCVWADLAPRTKRKHVDDRGARGTVNDVTVPARMLMIPLIDELDVWVNAKTDDRYYVHQIQHAAEIRGVPLVANVELRPAPFSDIVYGIEIPQQVAALEA